MAITNVFYWCLSLRRDLEIDDRTLNYCDETENIGQYYKTNLNDAKITVQMIETEAWNGKR